MSHFFNFWSLSYHLLLAIYVTVFLQWFTVYVPMVMEFQPEMRYNVFKDLEIAGNFMNNVNTAQLAAVVKMFEDADAITETQNSYMELSGIAMILVLFRMLRLLEFQPRLALITKTVYHALEDMIHFFAIMVVIMGLYLVQSYYLFGSYIDDYSTLSEAWTANFNMLLGDTGHFNAITDKFSIAGYLFCYSFNIIVFFILLNILLAIVVEAYMKVVEDNTANSSKSVPDQLMDMASSTVKKWSFVRNRADNWMAKQYVSDTYIANELGDGAEDPDRAERKVMYTPLAEGEWLEPGVASIVKALTVHPDTRDIDMHKKICIAASMIYRHGEPERDSTEASATLNFAEKELAYMAAEIDDMATKAKLHNAIQLWVTIGQRRGLVGWKRATWPEEAKMIEPSNSPAQEDSSKFEGIPAGADGTPVPETGGTAVPETGGELVDIPTGFFEFGDLFGGCTAAAPPSTVSTAMALVTVSVADNAVGAVDMGDTVIRKRDSE